MQLNPAIELVLIARASGWKHSEINWKAMRVFFDFANQEVEEEDA